MRTMKEERAGISQMVRQSWRAWLPRTRLLVMSKKVSIKGAVMMKGIRRIMVPEGMPRRV